MSGINCSRSRARRVRQRYALGLGWRRTVSLFPFARSDGCPNNSASIKSDVLPTINCTRITLAEAVAAMSIRTTSLVVMAPDSSMTPRQIARSMPVDAGSKCADGAEVVHRGSARSGRVTETMQRCRLISVKGAAICICEKTAKQNQSPASSSESNSCSRGPRFNELDGI
jgi:hypothetical protein